MIATLLLVCTGCEQRGQIEKVAAGTQCRQFTVPLTQDPVTAPSYGIQCLMPGSQWVMVSAPLSATRTLAAPLGTLYPAPADIYWITTAQVNVWPHFLSKGGDPFDISRTWNGGVGIGP